MGRLGAVYFDAVKETLERRAVSGAEVKDVGIRKLGIGS